MTDLTGQKFGKLKVVEYSYSKDKPHWLCICDCGKEIIVNGNSLKRGNTKSCGCFTLKRTHGLSNKPKEYYQHRMKNPFAKLRQRISCAVGKSLKKSGSSKNRHSCFDYLPYSIQKLKEHLEKQFEPWMNWDNYGGKSNNKDKTWWIDHIKPQSQFQYTSMDDPLFVECWALNNLRPLEKISNIQKGAKWRI